MLIEHLFEQVGRAVEGKAEVSYLALSFLFKRPVKAVELFIEVIVIAVFKRVQQVEVKVVHTCTGELFVKYPVTVVLSLHIPRRELGRNGKAVTGVFFKYHISDDILRLAAVVDVSSIKVVEPCRHIVVYHRTYTLIVDFAVLFGKSHKPEAELWHFCKINWHKSVLLLFMDIC